jgi:indolepyruvate ferredoxin oxidoreductase beta subunit
MLNSIIAGVGGQGTVLASKIIAAAAMRRGFDVRTTETIGMAQRGGCVIGHNRIGKNINELFSPIIPVGGADAIIAFEPAEAVRQLHFLSPKGRVVVCGTAVKPIGSAVNAYEGAAMVGYLKENIANLIVIDGEEIMQTCAKALNVAILGAAAESGVFPFDAEAFAEILPEIVPERFIGMNKAAFALGGRLCRAYRQ